MLCALGGFPGKPHTTPVVEGSRSPSCRQAPLAVRVEPLPVSLRASSRRAPPSAPQRIFVLSVLSDRHRHGCVLPPFGSLAASTSAMPSCAQRLRSWDRRRTGGNDSGDWYGQV